MHQNRLLFGRQDLPCMYVAHHEEKALLIFLQCFVMITIAVIIFHHTSITVYCTYSLVSLHASNVSLCECYRNENQLA